MARPARYASRETGKSAEELGDRDSHRTVLTTDRQPGKRVATEEDPDAAEGLNRTIARRAPLDDEVQSRQSSRHGQVSEGELELSRSVASRMGWVPLEE